MSPVIARHGRQRERAAGGFVGALLAVPIAATAEVLLEGFQARDVPVAQDPTAVTDRDDTNDDDAQNTSNAPDDPDGRRQPRGRRAAKATAEPD